MNGPVYSGKLVKLLEILLRNTRKHTRCGHTCYKDYRACEVMVSQTPPPAAVACCSGMLITTLRWKDIGNFDVNFEIDYKEDKDKSSQVNDVDRRRLH